MSQLWLGLKACLIFIGWTISPGQMPYKASGHYKASGQHRHMTRAETFRSESGEALIVSVLRTLDKDMPEA
jgi:hypothetical protein